MLFRTLSGNDILYITSRKIMNLNKLLRTGYYSKQKFSNPILACRTKNKYFMTILATSVVLKLSLTRKLRSQVRIKDNRSYLDSVNQLAFVISSSLCEGRKRRSITPSNALNTQILSVFIWFTKCFHSRFT